MSAGGTVDFSHWVIEYTEPTKRSDGQGPSWMANRSLNVLTNTAERAIELLRQAHPEGVIHVVRKVGAAGKTIFDLEQSGRPS